VNQAVDSDTLMRHCRSFPGVSEEHPWGPGDTVFKVGGKGFAFTGDSEATAVTLKFDAGEAEALRLLYPGTVTVAPYLTRGGWCNVRIDGTVPDSELAAWVRRSYEIVASSLTRKKRAELGIKPSVAISRRRSG
jgi:predicted DNA-binding protein (MmcQ/YjbR family)